MTKEEFQNLKPDDEIWFPHGGPEGAISGAVSEIVKEYVIAETCGEFGDLLYSIHREDAFLTREEALKEKEKQNNGTRKH